MAKNPSTTFFWSDWENDQELRTCSLAAQGLWMRMLCIAARSPEPGVVLMGGFPPSRNDIAAPIARLVGLPLDEVNALIDELLTSGAASLDRKNRIVNRRMVRAAALHDKRARAGRNGADVTNGKTKRNDGLPQQSDGKSAGKDAGKPPPSSRLQDFKTPNPPAEEASRGDPAGEAVEPPKASSSSLTCAAAASREETDQAYALWQPVAYDLRIPDPGFINQERRSALAARLAEIGGIDGWKRALERLRTADWLRDDDDATKPKAWLNLATLCKPENFTGLLEGRYAERRAKPDAGPARESFEERRIRLAREALRE